MSHLLIPDRSKNGPNLICFLPGMLHFKRVSVQKIRQRNSLCLYLVILASPWSVLFCRETRQNVDLTQYSLPWANLRRCE